MSSGCGPRRGDGRGATSVATGRGGRSRGAQRRAMPCRCALRRLASPGVADVVELRREGRVAGAAGRAQARPTQGHEVQLCAQGLCLEEMLGTPVPGRRPGRTRRRLDVALDQDLRALARHVVAESAGDDRGGADAAPDYEKKNAEAARSGSGAGRLAVGPASRVGSPLRPPRRPAPIPTRSTSPARAPGSTYGLNIVVSA